MTHRRPAPRGQMTYLVVACVLAMLAGCDARPGETTSDRDAAAPDGRLPGGGDDGTVAEPDREDGGAQPFAPLPATGATYVGQIGDLCEADLDCTDGTHCSLRRCHAGCNADWVCEPGTACGERGRCVDAIGLLGQTEPEDISFEPGQVDLPGDVDRAVVRLSNDGPRSAPFRVEGHVEKPAEGPADVIDLQPTDGLIAPGGHVDIEVTVHRRVSGSRSAGVVIFTPRARVRIPVRWNEGWAGAYSGQLRVDDPVDMGPTAIGFALDPAAPDRPEVATGRLLARATPGVTHDVELIGSREGGVLILEGQRVEDTFERRFRLELAREDIDGSSRLSGRYAESWPGLLDPRQSSRRSGELTLFAVRDITPRTPAPPVAMVDPAMMALVLPPLADACPTAYHPPQLPRAEVARWLLGEPLALPEVVDVSQNPQLQWLVDLAGDGQENVASVCCDPPTGHGTMRCDAQCVLPPAERMAERYAAEGYALADDCIDDMGADGLHRPGPPDREPACLDLARVYCASRLLLEQAERSVAPDLRGALIGEAFEALRQPLVVATYVADELQIRALYETYAFDDRLAALEEARTPLLEALQLVVQVDVLEMLVDPVDLSGRVPFVLQFTRTLQRLTDLEARIADMRVRQAIGDRAEDVPELRERLRLVDRMHLAAGEVLRRLREAPCPDAGCDLELVESAFDELVDRRRHIAGRLQDVVEARPFSDFDLDYATIPYVRRLEDVEPNWRVLLRSVSEMVADVKVETCQVRADARTYARDQASVQRELDRVRRERNERLQGICGADVELDDLAGTCGRRSGELRQAAINAVHRAFEREAVLADMESLNERIAIEQSRLQAVVAELYRRIEEARVITERFKLQRAVLYGRYLGDIEASFDRLREAHGRAFEAQDDALVEADATERAIGLHTARLEERKAWETNRKSNSSFISQMIGGAAGAIAGGISQNWAAVATGAGGFVSGLVGLFSNEANERATRLAQIAHDIAINQVRLRSAQRRQQRQYAMAEHVEQLAVLAEQWHQTLASAEMQQAMAELGLDFDLRQQSAAIVSQINLEITRSEHRVAELSLGFDRLDIEYQMAALRSDQAEVALIGLIDAAVRARDAAARTEALILRGPAADPGYRPMRDEQVNAAENSFGWVLVRVFELMRALENDMGIEPTFSRQLLFATSPEALERALVRCAPDAYNRFTQAYLAPQRRGHTVRVACDVFGICGPKRLADGTEMSAAEQFRALLLDRGFIKPDGTVQIAFPMVAIDNGPFTGSDSCLAHVDVFHVNIRTRGEPAGAAARRTVIVSHSGRSFDRSCDGAEEHQLSYQSQHRQTSVDATVNRANDTEWELANSTLRDRAVLSEWAIHVPSADEAPANEGFDPGLHLADVHLILRYTSHTVQRDALALPPCAIDDVQVDCR